jgi:hypothetical protein
VEVRFTHPRTSSSYRADVSPLLTAQQALNHLLSSETGPFLSPPYAGESYELTVRRVSKVILPHETMIQAGVQMNDVLDVTIHAQGA